MSTFAIYYKKSNPGNRRRFTRENVAAETKEKAIDRLAEARDLTAEQKAECFGFEVYWSKYLGRYVTIPTN